ncbi:MAG: hypothetical protein AB8B87_25075, partial [Granulosicoccus sp.]
WNTINLQSYFNRSLQGTSDISIEHLSKIAPIHHRYINFNGHFTFPIEQGEDRLFKRSFNSAKYHRKVKIKASDCHCYAFTDL